MKYKMQKRLKNKLKKIKEKEKTVKKENKTNKQITITATYNSPCLHHRGIPYQVIAINDQQIGHTSLIPLSP